MIRMTRVTRLKRVTKDKKQKRTKLIKDKMKRFKNADLSFGNLRRIRRKRKLH